MRPFLVVLGIAAAAGSVWAVDTGWMRPGVRAWYFGGVGGGSDAEEAFLITAISGGNVHYTKHSAVGFWQSPKPVESNLGAPINGTDGSFWILPAVLQTLKPGDFWMDGQIVGVWPGTYTYDTFPYHLLPARALFAQQAQRTLVKITYWLDTSGLIEGLAYFDAETGLCLMYTSRWPGFTVFFILAEINYDFDQHTAFAEDNGPHAGMKSWASESSLGVWDPVLMRYVGGGTVNIQSAVETRYKNQIEMWVESSSAGPSGSHPLTFENYYFDGDIPVVKRIDHDHAGDLPPDQWNPFGTHLWWWVPPGATASPPADIILPNSAAAINVLDVSMTKTSSAPVTFTAASSPGRFYFSSLILDANGYMTSFSAKDPAIGLDVKTTDLPLLNNTTVNGLSYYLNTMGTAVPTWAMLHLSKTALNFGSLVGGTPTSSQTVVITNTGGGALDWTATPSVPWLTVTPGSGTGGGTVSFAIDTNVPHLWPGTYNGSVAFTDPNASNSPQSVSVTLKVYAAGATTVPFGDFATPLEGTAGITGAIPVTGWILDDIQTTKVEIWRDPVLSAGEVNSLYYIGVAIFVEGARPDVEADYPTYPMNSKAGWGYLLLTNFLPNQGNGTYKLYAIVTDKEGNVFTLGTKTITCDNAHATKPFGTIDTPAQGGDASGNPYLNFGWVLTPLPKTVPADGSTISVYVDSALVGTLATAPNVYNQYRADVAGNFPGLNNTSGPVGAYFLDTTAYASGVHTIYWIAYDDAGAGDGIGSRYFNIVNTGGGPEPTPQGADPQAKLGLSRVSDLGSIPRSYLPVFVETGLDLKAEPRELLPDPSGVYRVEIPELGRVVIDLGGESELASVKSGQVTYSGYLVVGDVLRPLPIGSTLDSRTGRFSWMPGPGFIGTYAMVFLRKRVDNSLSMSGINVVVAPKK